jgi:DNA modification methylase
LYFMECGFNLHDTMIYAKSSYMPKTHNRYEQAFEYIFVLSKGRPAAFNPLMVPCVTAGTKRNRAGAKQREAEYAERARNEMTTVNAEKQHPNVFFYDVGKNDKTAHNAPFPEGLAGDAVKSWSNPGDTVLDPFLGSGTTGKMAAQLGRFFIGVDISQEYVDLARRRIDGQP